MLIIRDCENIGGPTLTLIYLKETRTENILKNQTRIVK